jgi:hypothetical protein
MNAYAIGQSAALEEYFGKTASQDMGPALLPGLQGVFSSAGQRFQALRKQMSSRVAENAATLQQQLRRAAVIGKIGIAGIGGAGAVPHVQELPPAASMTQKVLTGAGAGAGSIAGAVHGGVTKGLEGVGEGHRRGAAIGAAFMSEAARKRSAAVAFPP